MGHEHPYPRAGECALGTLRLAGELLCASSTIEHEIPATYEVLTCVPFVDKLTSD
jgi:hypothetical protein